MKLIKVAGVSLNQTPFDWENNLKHILEAIEKARSEKISLVCFPELCITGYGCEDMFQSPSLNDMTIQMLMEILPHTKDMIVSVGMPLFFKKSIFNTACLIVDRKILGFAAKKFLAGDGIHYEPRWFKPWPTGMHSTIEIEGQKYPIGDIHFDISGIKIGFEICEDAWVSRRPGSELARKGIDIILNPSASHFAFGKYDIRKDFVLEGSRAFGVAYIYSNLMGCESGRIIFDGGNLIASGGKLMASGKRLSFQDIILTSAVIEIDKIRMAQSKIASFQADLEEDDSTVYHEFDYPEIELDKELDNVEANLNNENWENSKFRKEEEFARAVSLALYDYMRKSYSKGFVVSLSGGADSSAVATLIYLMLEFGIKEIGLENFLKKLSYMEDKLKDLTTTKEIMKKILTCAYQATNNSGEVTKNAAKSLAEELGADFMDFNINEIVKHYVEMVSAGIGRKFSWKTDDILLQNIQARVRGPSVWMLANERGALLLTTSNRSEAAVGYATMDGDTCGGLCPIGGIDKNFLRSWLRWLEHHGADGFEKIPVLKLINEQEPTAELRPAGTKQTDEKDLMPYDVLDAIERAAIRDKRSPKEVFILMKGKFNTLYSEEDLKTWVKRFFRLWCINQWKRERYAPAFHVDDENLDPKTWCRFPILSGGYKKELAELDGI
ncbi:MAG: NAD(+) synthase [Candidatus Sericytochromatia bacterium]